AAMEVSPILRPFKVARPDPCSGRPGPCLLLLVITVGDGPAGCDQRRIQNDIARPALSQQPPIAIPLPPLAGDVAPRDKIIQGLFRHATAGIFRTGTLTGLSNLRRVDAAQADALLAQSERIAIVDKHPALFGTGRHPTEASGHESQKKQEDQRQPVVENPAHIAAPSPKLLPPARIPPVPVHMANSWLIIPP